MTTPLDDYIEAKIRMLKKDFCILLEREELWKLEECKSERQCDRVARDIIFSHLGR